jgi:septum formation protein
VILASSSPRRRELLERAGLSFEVQSRQIDESPHDGESPLDLATRLARGKAEAVARLQPQPSLVLGADTIVVLGDTILGKPSDPQDAIATLQLLSGKQHRVITAFALTCGPEATVWSVRSVHTDVYFQTLNQKRIERYVESGEPMDKAGSYGIQGLGGALVERIEGSYSNVVGLPIVEVIECIARMGGPQL